MTGFLSRQSARAATTRSGMARKAGMALPFSLAAKIRNSSAVVYPAIPTTPTAAISKPRRTASLSAASIFPTAIRRRARRFDYKLRWFKRLSDHAKKLLNSKEPVVLAGDYNVMPTDLDVYAPERWVDDALFRPEVREAYRNLVAQGWTDAIRKLHPDKRVYTFWKYWRNAFARDAGLRIDHLLLNAPAAKRLVAAGVDRNVRARPGTSDHAPTWIELATQSPKRNASAPKTRKKA